MRLYEEFELYENMWDDISSKAREKWKKKAGRCLTEEFEESGVDSDRFTEVTYNGDAAAISTRNRFPLQINTTKQMMADLNSPTGYRGYRLINVQRGNTIVKRLVKLDKAGRIIDEPSNINLEDAKAINDYINSRTTNKKGNITEAAATDPFYSGSLRAYAYFGGTPKNRRTFDNTSVNMPYTDPDNLDSTGCDDYAFSGTLEAWIRKLNKIAKHHQIVQLEIVDEHEHVVFYAADTDPDTWEEYDDVIVFKNEIFKGYEPFMKQFVVPDSNISSLKEAVNKQYYVELRAYDKNTIEEYDDADNLANTDEYTYWGTKEEVVNKLNQIAKTCDFSFIFIYDDALDPYDDADCVFEASDTDAKTDKEFSKPVIFKNNFIAAAPFMKDFISKSTLVEASGNRPTPPTTIKIVKIEPKLQEPYDDPARRFKHYDEITYIDPIFNAEMKTSVWEKQPGFGNYFGWGAKHSGSWDYAAYSYEGKLLPGVDPNSHVAPAMKTALSDIVDKINNPSDYDEEE